jgi:hypothetical protein
MVSFESFEELRECIEIDPTLENNVETFQKVDKKFENAEGPTMQTRRRKSLTPRKSTKAAINKKLNNKKQITENGHDKKTQKKPSSLKPKKSSCADTYITCTGTFVHVYKKKGIIVNLPLILK